MNTRISASVGKGLRIAVFWLVVILAVVLDQATKAAAREILEDGPKTLLPGVINLVHVENSGAAFSIGQGGSALFVVVALVFLIAAIVLVWKTPDLPYGLVVTIGLVAGGGLGNMVDRVMGGTVTDFLSTAFMKFPVFNVADICVTVGIFTSVIGYWVWDSRKEGETHYTNMNGHSHA